MTNYQNVGSFSNEPLTKYIDLNVRSFSNSDTAKEKILRFSDTRNIPIIADCSKYKMSVVRFEIDTFSLPVLTFQAERNSSDVNRGSYAVYLEYDDGLGSPYPITTPNHVFWTPQNQNEVIPPAPIDNQFGMQKFVPYYYCYSYQYFLELVNNALSAAMVELIGLVGALAGVEGPFMNWDSVSQRATMYARKSHFDTDVFPKINIYMNRSLYSLFSSFSFINFPQRYPNLHRMELSSFYRANVTTMTTFGVNELVFSVQETTTIGNMSPVSSIVFTSSTLPIVSNDLSTPQIFVDGEFLNYSSTFSNGEQIITDMSNDEGYRSSLIYTPSGQYRFVSLLKNHQPIKSLDINVYWRNYLGQLQAFLLQPGGSSSIKILFQKLTEEERISTHKLN